MYVGEPITKEKAKEQSDKFKEKHGEDTFPKAVCYRLEELEGFISKAKEAFEEKGIPATEQGVSMTFGIHLGDRPHAKDKETVMLIATHYIENDTKSGKVDKIKNPLVSNWPEPQMVDYCYDAASLWP